MKVYEDHVRRTSDQVSHAMMQEIIASFAAVEVDKPFGSNEDLSFFDREKAKHRAGRQTHKLAEEKYKVSVTVSVSR